jgi:Lytic polysaccharide mono-oxygenase, cellulose-degrading
MSLMAFSRTQRRSVFATSAAAVVLALFVSAPADAHFQLQAPANWLEQDSDGVPIKLGPCGDEQDDSGAQPTGTVTVFQEGQQVTVTINEVIFHPGFYRIALATDDRGQLPKEPQVDASATDPCDKTTFEDPPVFPVLADDVFEHVSPFSTPQSTQITLPAGVTCDHCTLQVIEFMSDHSLNIPGGCFYHHCANIKIQSEPVQSTSDGGGQVIGGGGIITPDASTSGLGSSDPSLDQSNDSACGCSIPGSKKPTAAGIAIGFLAMLLISRRRRVERRAGV